MSSRIARCRKLLNLDAGAPAPRCPARISEPVADGAHVALLAVAAYAARTLHDTDGMWPPAARATQCRRALEHIQAECRQAHAAATANDEVPE
jgi:hypothetical protein